MKIKTVLFLMLFSSFSPFVQAENTEKQTAEQKEILTDKKVETSNEFVEAPETVNEAETRDNTDPITLWVQIKEFVNGKRPINSSATFLLVLGLITMLLTWIGGLLSEFLPFIREFPTRRYQVLAWGATLTIGLANGMNLTGLEIVMTLFSSGTAMVLYEWLLKKGISSRQFSNLIRAVMGLDPSTLDNSNLAT